MTGTVRTTIPEASVREQPGIPVISFRQVSARIGSKEILHDLSFDVKAGEQDASRNGERPGNHHGQTYQQQVLEREIDHVARQGRRHQRVCFHLSSKQA